MLALAVTCAVLGAGPVQRVHVVRTVQPGEQLTVHYVSLNEPRLVRQMQLLRKKHFTCGCQRCLMPMAESPDRFLEVGNRLMHLLLGQRCSGEAHLKCPDCLLDVGDRSKMHIVWQLWPPPARSVNGGKQSEGACGQGFSRASASSRALELLTLPSKACSSWCATWFIRGSKLLMCSLKASGLVVWGGLHSAFSHLTFLSHCPGQNHEI